LSSRGVTGQTPFYRNRKQLKTAVFGFFVTGRAGAAMVGFDNERGAVMSEHDQPNAGDTHQAFVDMLDASGFFRQIKVLEESLGIIAGELKSFGENSKARADETENLAAHVLAMESIIAVMAKAFPVDEDAVKAEIQDRTAALTGDGGGSPTVQALALEILGKAK